MGAAYNCLTLHRLTGVMNKLLADAMEKEAKIKELEDQIEKPTPPQDDGET